MTTSNERVLERQVLGVGLDPVELEALRPPARRAPASSSSGSGRSRSPSRRGAAAGIEALPVPAATSSTRWPGRDPARLDEPRPERQQERLDHRRVVARGPHRAVAGLELGVCGLRSVMVVPRVVWIVRSSFAPHGRTAHRENSLSAAHLRPGPPGRRVGGRLGAVADAELGEDAADVVAGGLLADDERPRDARRWTCPSASSSSTSCSRAVSSPPVAGARAGSRSAELAQHRRSGVRPRATRRARGTPRTRSRASSRASSGCSSRQRARELQPRLADVERHRQQARRRRARGGPARPRRAGPGASATRATASSARAPTSRMPTSVRERGELAAGAACRRRRPRTARRASTSGASSCVARIASPCVPRSPRSSSAAATRGSSSAMRRSASARSDSGCSSRPASSCSASASRPWRTRSSASAATVGAPICGTNRACVVERGLERRSASGQRPVATRTSAWTVRQAPNSGAASCSRAKSSTSSHHSRGALPLAGVRARHDQVAVGLGERVDVADAPGASRPPSPPRAAHARLAAPGADLRPPEQAEREHLEVGRRPRRRAISIARVACSMLLLDASACRARSTATQPCPAHGPCPRARARRGASQPRAADARPPTRCWWETQTATRAAPSQRPLADVRLERPLARGDAVRDLAEEPQREPQALERPRTPRPAGPLEARRAPHPLRAVERVDGFGQREALGAAPPCREYRTTTDV